MYQVTIELKSLCPYIQNNPIESIAAVRDSTSVTRIGKQEASPQKTGYFDEKGFYIPARQIRGIMIIAGKKVKLGRANISNFIKACVFPASQKFYMMRNEKPITKEDGIYNDPIIRKDGQMVFNPRVMFNNWEASIILNVTQDSIPKAKIIEVLTIGGIYIGIGSRRPEFGRFALG